MIFKWNLYELYLSNFNYALIASKPLTIDNNFDKIVFVKICKKEDFNMSNIKNAEIVITLEPVAE